MGARGRLKLTVVDALITVLIAIWLWHSPER
jgi:hypothetical protein